jgi:hypothetical protein
MTSPTSQPNQQTGRMNWFDQQFSQIGWPMLIALTVLFTILMCIFSGIGWAVTKNPTAHRRAKIIFIISAVYVTGCFVAVFILVRNPDLLK